MAGSPPGSEGAPRLPSAKLETRRSAVLPPPLHKKSSTDRVIVKLSSVAKLPPPLATAAPPKQVPARTSAPPGAILPPKEAAGKTGGAPPLRQPQLNRTMQVKLPEKSGILPKLTTLASMPLTPVGSKAAEESLLVAPVLTKQSESLAKPPPLPAVQPEEKNAAGRITAMKLKPLRMETSGPGESIFPDEEPKALRSEPAMSASAPSLSVEGTSAETVNRAPGLRDDGAAKPPGGLLPPPIPSAVEKPAALPHAPPLVVRAPGESSEKHRLPPALRKAAVTPSEIPQAPPLVEPPMENSAEKNAAPSALAMPVSLAPGKESGPGVSASAAPTTAEAKLPAAASDQGAKRAGAFFTGTEGSEFLLGQPELPVSSAKKDFAAIPSTAAPASLKAGAPAPAPAKPPVALPFFAGLFARRGKKLALPSEPRAKAEKVVEPRPIKEVRSDKPLGGAPPGLPPALATTTASGAPVPLPRSARIRKKRWVETIAFYVIFLCIVVPLLFFLAFILEARPESKGRSFRRAGCC